jgi:hypothetical protein
MKPSSLYLNHDLDGYYAPDAYSVATTVKVTYPMGYIPKIQEYSDALADAASDGNLRAIGRAKASLDYFYDREITNRRDQIHLLQQNQW